MNASKPQAKLDMRLRATECPNGSQPPNAPHRKPSTMRLMKSVFMGVCSERVLAKTNMSAPLTSVDVTAMRKAYVVRKNNSASL